MNSKVCVCVDQEASFTRPLQKANQVQKSHRQEGLIHKIHRIKHLNKTARRQTTKSWSSKEDKRTVEESTETPNNDCPKSFADSKIRPADYRRLSLIIPQEKKNACGFLCQGEGRETIGIGGSETGRGEEGGRGQGFTPSTFCMACGTPQIKQAALPTGV